MDSGSDIRVSAVGQSKVGSGGIVDLGWIELDTCAELLENLPMDKGVLEALLLLEVVSLCAGWRAFSVSSFSFLNLVCCFL